MNSDLYTFQMIMQVGNGSDMEVADFKHLILANSISYMHLPMHKKPSPE